ncbi:hypothetical protein EG329_000429 [Mollisiaceae sp. DMI_Dod_QoI]|nr:hypothetical protein EG329_000429 [Helotiales sp. DMI_Dod_QoI]
MSDAERSHFDLPINKGDFELGQLKPLCHSVSSVSNALIDYVNQVRFLDEKDWHPKQQQALKRLKTDGTWNFGNPYNLEDLTKWFEIYNDAFFGGLPTGLCKLEIVDYKTLYYIGSRLVAGICQTRMRHGRPESTLKFAFGSHFGPFKRVKTLLSDLIHEMLHSNFDLYICCCKDCSGVREGAHAAHWQRSALAIEEVTKEENLNEFGLGLNLGRNESMASDIFEGCRLPNDAELQSLKLDISIIPKMVQIFHKMKEKDGPDAISRIDGEEKLPALPLRKTIMEPFESDHLPQRLATGEFEVGHLKPHSYSAEDISAAIVQFLGESTYNCKIENLATRQQRALKKFKRQGTWHIGNPHNLEDIENYFEIFDDAYLNGLLRGFCKLELIDSKTPRKRRLQSPQWRLQCVPT